MKSAAISTQSEETTSSDDNFKSYNQINERQNLNSTLIMNENATPSSGSSDENINQLVRNEEQEDRTLKEESINKENEPVLNSNKELGANKVTGVSNVLNPKVSKNLTTNLANKVTTLNEQLIMEKMKPRSFSNNSNSSSDSDFY